MIVVSHRQNKVILMFETENSTYTHTLSKSEAEELSNSLIVNDEIMAIGNKMSEILVKSVKRKGK